MFISLDAARKNKLSRKRVLQHKRRKKILYVHMLDYMYQEIIRRSAILILDQMRVGMELLDLQTGTRFMFSSIFLPLQ